MICSTRWRGNAEMTAAMDSASLRVGITTATLLLTDDLEYKAGDAGNDRLLAATQLRGIRAFFVPAIGSSAIRNSRMSQAACRT